MYKGEKIVNAIPVTDEVLLFFKKNPTITIDMVCIGNIRLLESQKNIAEYDKYMEMFQQIRSDMSIQKSEQDKTMCDLRGDLQNIKGDIVKTVSLQSAEQDEKRITILTKQIESNINSLKSILVQDISEQNNKLLSETVIKVKNEEKDTKNNDILQGKIDSLSSTLSSTLLSVSSTTLEIRNDFKSHFDKYKSATSRGQLGEKYVYNILRNIYNPKDITSDMKSHSGDFIIQREGLRKLMIEVKNYDIPIQDAIVKKFIGEVRNSKHHGIMISLGSEYVSRNDYHVELIKHDNEETKSILVYISNSDNIMALENTKSMEAKIRSAINIINMLDIYLEKTTVNEIVLTQKQVTTLTETYTLFLNKKSLLTKHLQESIEMLGDINFDVIKSIISPIVTIEATIESELSCKYCGKKYKGKANLHRHIEKFHSDEEKSVFLSSEGSEVSTALFSKPSKAVTKKNILQFPKIAN